MLEGTTEKSESELKNEATKFRDECQSLRTELHLTKDLHSSTSSELGNLRKSFDSFCTQNSIYLFELEQFSQHLFQLR